MKRAHARDNLGGNRMTIYPIPSWNLAVSAAPRSSADLADLRRQGVEVLVTVLTREEMHEMGFPDLGTQWKELGGVWEWIPCPDRGIPERWPAPDSRFVCVHCRAGVGRSTLAAGSLRVRGGLTPEKAWQILEEARGCPVPDTDEQRQALLDYRPRRAMSLEDALRQLEG